MAETRTRMPFGTWPSPISPAMMAGTRRLSDIAWDTTSERLLWLEGRSDRGVIVMDPGDGNAPCDITPDHLTVRGGVGYGGGEFTVHDGVVFFAEGKSGRIFRQSLSGGGAKPITPEFGRAASPTVSPDGQWLLYVHTDNTHDCLAVVDTAGKCWPQKLADKADFYMQPCWSPDGSRIAWVSWKHPNMPWDGTTLWMAELTTDPGPLPLTTSIKEVAGSDRVAIFQPQFAPDGKGIGFVSDETNFGNLYLQDLNSGERDSLTSLQAEINRPAWIQGIRTWSFTPDGKQVVFSLNDKGVHRLMRRDVAGDAEPTDVPTDDEYTAFDQLCVHPDSGRIAVIAGSSTIPSRVVSLELPAEAEPATVRIAARSSNERVPREDLAPCEPVSWKSEDGKTVHGLWYPPVNTKAESPGLPPAIISIHGGPTAMRDARYDAGVQFLATRGFGVLQVNHRGSTGYGRNYAQALRSQWGVIDVEDAVGGGQFLLDEHLADGHKLVIMGGSAGGYTVLRALTTKPGFFRAGVCLYGVSDLFMLADDTHKFESRYTDSLVGPLPEANELYRDRSPLHQADAIVDPIALYQGADDKVVPQNQSDLIVASLKARGVPHEYTVYEGEGHGWRKSETVRAFWQSVDAFLRRFVVYS